jgi:DNA repair protein RecO (recombination protein O)
VKRRRGSHRAHRTLALLLRRVEHGETDLVLSFFTESLGRISAHARGARKSSRRFGGALEPFHTLRIDLDEPSGADLFALRESTLDVPRLALTSSLERMDAAGRALGWVRVASPPRTVEPDVWRETISLLDRLNDGASTNPRLVLAEQGLRLLAAFGWGLDFERCVKCGKPCEKGRSAFVDPVRGGLLCRACGSARLKLSGAARERLATLSLSPEDVETALDLVEQTLKAHAG